MTFYSLLFPKPDPRLQHASIEMPAFFVDLNLDQVVNDITIGYQEYDLKPFFYLSLTEIDAVMYRHEIMRDLEHKGVMDAVEAFAFEMRTMRKYLAQVDKLYYQYQKESWFLDAAEIYCSAVTNLLRDLSGLDIKSRGFLGFRQFLTDYIQSAPFGQLFAEIKQLKQDLSTVQYEFLIKGSTIKVRKYEGERDYSTEVLATFDKFKQGAVKSYLVEFREGVDMNHVEAKVLEFVGSLYPEIFTRLDAFHAQHAEFLNTTVGTFDREVQFYIAYLDYISNLKRLELAFCYPQMINPSKEISSRGGFDIALAGKLWKDHIPVVTNDFYLQGNERIIVVSGPNQGGKTTFARTFGQLHYLASLGCPVPGSEARLFLFDHLFTHFEKEETISNLRGKLEDDLVRIEEILQEATSDSIIILNEIFTSTTLSDAIFLSRKILDRIIAMDMLCVCVTFIDELASLDKTISMVSTVFPDNPSERTFKILRKPADGLAYALSIAEKYRITYHHLKERLNHESISPVS